ncbi:MAG: phosphate ABC transporter permease PstA [candidate division WOR-3 bacterium]|uniref:Phosphate transport system permease protein PstA n=1 Tax=candidate division WOR-3 bacterium TaxID=2052148 RepID=A0A7C3INT6_UNCW3|nr:phosphate ABC transporter permease PstA [candidate division WOR-3 bacterium]
MNSLPADRRRRKYFLSNVYFLFLAVPVIIFLVFVAYMVFYLFRNGINVISWEFITRPPERGMTAGGILPCIVGTLYVTLVSLIFSIPIGVFAAIYLAEYAPNNLLTRMIRSAVRSLAGIPSIVYGLFGVALFVRGVHLGLSVLASGLTLGLMNLPWIIATAEEALSSIPGSFREGALAVGATKWEAIRHNVLPFAFPGILTGILLALARTMGETAPILFTGVTYFTRELPRSPLQKFMALPYHLFALATQHDQLMKARPIAFGTAAVLLILVLMFDGVAFLLRMRIATANKWQV